MAGARHDLVRNIGHTRNRVRDKLVIQEIEPFSRGESFINHSATGLSSLGERIKDRAEFAIFAAKCQQPRSGAGFRRIFLRRE